MKTSPTQRSLKLLRDEGWTVAITEKWNPFARIRQDLYGFIDLLAIREGFMLAVQTTTLANISAREKKIKESPTYKILKSTGCDICVHGWKKLKSGFWECKIIRI
jgi:hypothetical protein